MTFLDRFGPDGVHAPGVWWRLFLAGVALAVPVYMLTRIFAGKYVAGYLGSFLVLALFFSAVSIFFSSKAGNAFGRVLLPRGKASPYQHDFSFEKSLVMQNRVTEALESFEERLRAFPVDSLTILEAAELNATKGSRARAVQLFRELQQMRDVSTGLRLNATNRLIDLFAKGSEANEAAMQSELRFLARTFPETKAGAAARELLRPPR
jgi:hypothetical protein